MTEQNQTETTVQTDALPGSGISLKQHRRQAYQYLSMHEMTNNKELYDHYRRIIDFNGEPEEHRAYVAGVVDNHYMLYMLDLLSRFYQNGGLPVPAILSKPEYFLSPSEEGNKFLLEELAKIQVFSVREVKGMESPSVVYEHISSVTSASTSARIEVKCNDLQLFVLMVLGVVETNMLPSVHRSQHQVQALGEAAALFTDFDDLTAFGKQLVEEQAKETTEEEVKEYGQLNIPVYRQIENGVEFDVLEEGPSESATIATVKVTKDTSEEVSEAVHHVEVDFGGSKLLLIYPDEARLYCADVFGAKNNETFVAALEKSVKLISGELEFDNA